MSRRRALQWLAGGAGTVFVAACSAATPPPPSQSLVTAVPPVVPSPTMSTVPASQPSAAQPRRGGTLRSGMTGNITTLDGTFTGVNQYEPVWLIYDLKLIISTGNDSAVRVPAIMAGEDVPDLFNIGHEVVVSNIPDFLKAACTDLTPFLAGDAIREYPNLAAFPAGAWESALYNGGIMGFRSFAPRCRMCRLSIRRSSRRSAQASRRMRTTSGESSRR